MSATNLTKNLKLPQFVASDKPSWLGDVNGAMKNIDDGIGVIKGDITKASDTASSAKSQSDANTVTLGNVNTELENIGNRVTALEAGGGTEQLEQRVNTISTDVEALQTRSDTFEENISQNGTDITALKSRVDTIQPKVNSNTDNITSLTATTTGLSTSVQKLTTDTATAISDSNIAKQLSQTNKTAIDELNSTISKSAQIGIEYASLTSTVNITEKALFINEISLGRLFCTGFHISTGGSSYKTFTVNFNIPYLSGKNNINISSTRFYSRTNDGTPITVSVSGLHTGSGNISLTFTSDKQGMFDLSVSNILITYSTGE